MKRFFLLADDDMDDADLFGEALSEVDGGITFRHVENGAGVFALLDGAQAPYPDVIFLDLNMPEMSGWQCLTRIKSHEAYKGIPVIMYTTSSHKKDKEIAMELGAEGLITKPCNFGVLKNMLHSLAGHLDGSLHLALAEIARMDVY